MEEVKHQWNILNTSTAAGKHTPLRPDGPLEEREHE